MPQRIQGGTANRHSRFVSVRSLVEREPGSRTHLRSVPADVRDAFDAEHDMRGTESDIECLCRKRGAVKSDA